MRTQYLYRLNLSTCVAPESVVPRLYNLHAIIDHVGNLMTGHCKYGYDVICNWKWSLNSQVYSPLLILRPCGSLQTAHDTVPHITLVQDDKKIIILVIIFVEN